MKVVNEILIFFEMMNYEMGPKGVVNLHQEKVGAGTKLFVHFLKPELKAAFVPSFMKSFNLILNHTNLNLRIENSIFLFHLHNRLPID